MKGEITSAEQPYEIRQRFHEVLRRLIGKLIAQDNAWLSLECLAVYGLTYTILGPRPSATSLETRIPTGNTEVSASAIPLTPSRAPSSRPG